MQFTLATLALVASVAVVKAQGVTSLLTPTASAPAGCATDYSGKFEITVVKPAAEKRSIEKRESAVLQLSGGVLTDAKGRIGAIVANHQFQFDGPPAQAGSIYTGGWSVCQNGSLALGDQVVFYQCKSGDFYNLYDDDSTGALCQQILIDIIPEGSSGGASQGSDGQPAASSAATQVTDGQIQASSAVTQISDGQVQATSAAAAVTQISDGQIQASSAAPVPVSQIGDGQIQVPPTPAPAPVNQITDGQIQASSAAPAVTQISDGQIQASSAAAAVTQISDGQIQASSAAAPVTQISDGQIQASSAAAPVTQISDGQIQASSAAAPVTTLATVAQISDGQVQATGNFTPSASPTGVTFNGAASTVGIAGSVLVAAFGVVVASLL